MQGLKDLPTEVDMSTGFAQMKRRLAAGRNNPLRWKHGSFRVPVGASPAHYETIRNVAIKRFVGQMDRDGWELRTRIKVEKSRFPAVLPDTNKVQEDQLEYVVTAGFRKVDFRHIRIEVPVH
jgi:hypothetical protein